MRSKKNSANLTIIKRTSRKESHGVHTGAWKVAFADFTLAMMALFMVLWIVSAVPEEERRMIIAKINGTSFLEGNPFAPITSPVFLSGDAVVLGGDIPGQHRRQDAKRTEGDRRGEEHTDNNREGEDSIQLPFPQSESLDEVLQRSRAEMEELARIIMRITSEYNAQSNLAIEIVPQGLRILVQDDKNREMFTRGSATLTPFFRKLLLELGPVLAKIDNKLVITGHTDSTQYPNHNIYSNWNLSGDRAMAARLIFEQGGVPVEHFVQVSGMADQMLLDKNDPLAASNRRIEIMVLTRSAADTLYQFFGQNGEKIVGEAVKRIQENKK